MGKFVTSQCNQCARENEHAVLQVVKRTIQNGSTKPMGGSLEEGPVEYQHVLTRYSILECRGCRDIHFVIAKRWEPRVDESEPNEVDIGPHLEESYYPPREFRRKPDWLGRFERRSFAELMTEFSARSINDAPDRSMPDEVFDLLDEIYRAIHIECWRVAVMGIRTIFDVISTEKVGDCGGFKEKLKQLVTHGFISERDADILYEVIELGNAAVHRGHGPRPDEVTASLDIIENMLRTMYLSPIQAQALSARTPRRKRDK